jgi:class 3 adenylate cyclase
VFEVFLSTVTRTVVFTDLANYTAKVARSDREGLRKILLDHEELVTPVVKRYGGRIVKNLGDSFLILFESATDGVRAALDVQHIVMQKGAIAIRLAMTTGDIEEISGDAFGECVNLAARILSKAPEEEIWFGMGTWTCMNTAEIPWEPVGRFRFKGIPGEQQVFRAVPAHQARLPDPVANAVKSGTLVRIERGSRPPLLPPEPVVLLEGFTPGSPSLQQAVEALPVLNPASLWMSAYNIAPSDRNDWVEAGRGLVIGTPEAIEQSIEETQQQASRSLGSDTIVLDLGSHADFELVMAGLALPVVPLSDVVASYFYDLLMDGRWVNRSDRAILRLEVDSQGVRVVCLNPGLSVNGRSLKSGERVTLQAGDTIATPMGAQTFYRGAHGYCGLIVADTEMRLGVAKGRVAELGREPNHPGLAFPDRRGQDNIRWCTGPRAARARDGGFTLDRALAGRRQASVQRSEEDLLLTPLHTRCPTYVFSKDSAEMRRITQPTAVGFDDLVVAGTTVIALNAVGDEDF